MDSLKVDYEKNNSGLLNMSKVVKFIDQSTEPSSAKQSSFTPFTPGSSLTKELNFTSILKNSPKRLSA